MSQGLPQGGECVHRIRSVWHKKNSIASNKYQKGSKLAWIAVTTVLCLGFLTLSSIYLNYVRDTIRQDAKGNLAELGGHIAQSLHSEINRTSEVLGSLALEVAHRGTDSEEEQLNFLTEQSDFWNFYDLAVIDNDGISHHQDGSKDTPMNRKLLTEALNSGKMTFDFLIAGGEDCVIFYVPLPHDERESSGYLAITGTYAVHNWDLLMNIDIYGGQAITQIITKDGVIITRGRGSEEPVYYNFLSYLENAKFESGITLEDIRQILKEEENLRISYQLDGKEYYLCGTPIGFNGWCLAFTVPTSIVNSAGDQMARSVLIICAGLSLVFLLFLVFYRTTQAHAQRRIWDAAYVDEVTGGANRHKFLLDAHEILAKTSDGYMLIYTNIDQFKLLNQRFGTIEADHILRNISQAFTKMLSKLECCARLTADHFVLLLHGDEIENRLTMLAQDQSVQTTQAGGSCHVRLTFGLCPIESSNSELTEVIDRANLAMKMSPMRENGIMAYNVAMMEQAAREKALTERLLQDSFQDEFSIFLQPKVDLATGLVVGAEALARWTNPEFGWVSPGEFIPLAEKAGVVCKIDWSAFDCVCKVLAKWREEGKELVPISFNLSKAQLAVPNFLDHYVDTIREYNTPCKYLDFEFTESLLYENSGALQTAVNKIHAMGAWCSMDDFGFGYSSLGLLGQFEADTLKLDRSFFLEDAQPDSRNNRIVRSVIQIAETLGMHTVAEGVEDEKHVDMLRQFGCDSIQGFYFSKPLPINEFEQFVIARRERISK